jgi:hypothetical protein
MPDTVEAHVCATIAQALDAPPENITARTRLFAGLVSRDRIRAIAQRLCSGYAIRSRQFPLLQDPRAHHRRRPARSREAPMSKHPQQARRVQSGVCRICGCTDERACDVGCSWVDAAHTLCSTCAGGPKHVIAELGAIDALLTARPQVRRLVLALRRSVKERQEDF